MKQRKKQLAFRMNMKFQVVFFPTFFINRNVWKVTAFCRSKQLKVSLDNLKSSALVGAFCVCAVFEFVL